MASLSQVNPMSLGEFNQYAGASGATQAAAGATGLAGAMIGNPAQKAQSQYLGAEAGRATLQGQALATTAAAQQKVFSILSDPAALQDYHQVQQAAAIVATQPELAAKFPSMISTMFQLNRAAGGTQAGTQANADTLSAGTGTAPMGSTATGYGAGLQNNLGVAGIAAGASRYGADAAANASMTNTRNIVAGENARTGVLVAGPPNPDGTQGAPHFEPAVTANANHAPAYNSPLAVAVAGQPPVPVVGPNGTTTLQTQAGAIANQSPVRAKTPTDVQGALVQDAVSPPPGGRPGAVPPEQAGAIRDAALATAAGRPPPGASTISDAAGLDGLITTRLKAQMPTLWQSNEPSQQLLDPIRLQATWIHEHDPQVRGDWSAAITKAINNVAGQDGSGLDYNTRLIGKSQVIQKQGAAIQWPPGMPVPSQYAGKGATPSPVAGAIAGTPAPPASTPPAAPASARPPGMSPLAGAMAAPPNPTPAPPAPAAAPPQPSPPQPQAQPTGPTPQAFQAAAANPAQAQQEALAAVARNPSARAVVIARLKQAGIPVPPQLAGP